MSNVIPLFPKPKDPVDNILDRAERIAEASREAKAYSEYMRRRAEIIAADVIKFLEGK